MSWKFNGNIVTEETTPEGAVGFVYKIIDTRTNRFYIGKKSLSQKKTTTLERVSWTRSEFTAKWVILKIKTKIVFN